MKRLLFVLAMASCAPQPPVFRPVAVEIPVTGTCPANPVAKPDFALSHVKAADDLFTKTRAMLVELEQRRAYETELEARIISICP